MTKRVNHVDNERIINAVKSFPNGATIETLTKLPSFVLPRRTLQRRLAQLVASGYLASSGQGRSRRYQYIMNMQSNLDLTHVRMSNAEMLYAAHDNHKEHHAQPTNIIARAQEPKPTYTSRTTSQQLAVTRIAEDYIPITVESMDIKNYVNQPMQRRAIVGYHREFLNAYVPNKTFYLSESHRNHLYALNGSRVQTRVAGTYARELLNRLLIDLSWNSSRLEGNTYSLLETEKLIAYGEVVAGKALFETQMLLNHKAAIEFLVDAAEQLDFNRYTILNLHALLSNNLLAPESCGRLRAIPVGISKAVYYPPEIPQVIDECFTQLLATAAAISNPFEQAFFIMVQLPYLQPFEDVNKRVSRLALNIPFIKNNLYPLSFIDVPEQVYIDGLLGVYECNRVELLRDLFVWAYERSAARYSVVQQTLTEPDPFRLRYRNQITFIVNDIAMKMLNKQEVTNHLRQWAENHIDENERQQFIAVIETELSSLHEGNIARYRITPATFQAWQNVYKR